MKQTYLLAFIASLGLIQTTVSVPTKPVQSQCGQGQIMLQATGSGAPNPAVGTCITCVNIKSLPKNQHTQCVLAGY